MQSEAIVGMSTQTCRHQLAAVMRTQFKQLVYCQTLIFNVDKVPHNPIIICEYFNPTVLCLQNKSRSTVHRLSVQWKDKKKIMEPIGSDGFNGLGIHKTLD